MFVLILAPEHIEYILKCFCKKLCIYPHAKVVFWMNLVVIHCHQNNRLAVNNTESCLDCICLLYRTICRKRFLGILIILAELSKKLYLNTIIFCLVKGDFNAVLFLVRPASVVSIKIDFSAFLIAELR